MDRRTRSGVFATTVVTLALLALLNVFAFAVPFPRVSAASHFVNYGAASLVIVAQGVIFALTMFGEQDANQRVLGLPIIRSGFVTLGLQAAVSASFFAINAFVDLAPWIVAVTEAAVAGYMVISVTKGFFFKSHALSLKEAGVRTDFMDELRARLRALCGTNRIEGVSRELEDLYDVARGSDPVSNEKTAASESELLSLLQELDGAIRGGGESDAREAIAKMRNALLERNALCKAGKRMGLKNENR